MRPSDSRRRAARLSRADLSVAGQWQAHAREDERVRFHCDGGAGIDAGDGAAAVKGLAARRGRTRRSAPCHIAVRHRLGRTATRQSKVRLSRARAFYCDGAFNRKALYDERVTRNKLAAAVRKSGEGDLGRIAAVVLETDGSNTSSLRPDCEKDSRIPLLAPAPYAGSSPTRVVDPGGEHPIGDEGARASVKRNHVRADFRLAERDLADAPCRDQSDAVVLQ
jgi:hypothetical protein